MLRESLPQQSVHVFVGSALPGLAGVGKEHAVGEEGRDFLMAGHFGALVPGQSPPEFLSRADIAVMSDALTSAAVCPPGRWRRTA